MIKVGLLIVSDRAFTGSRPDETIPLFEEHIEMDEVFILSATKVVPDEKRRINEGILGLVGECDLLLTSGGTGFAPSDRTPEVTLSLLERRADNIITYLMMESLKITPYAPITRGVAGTIGKTLVINLPGKPKSVIESFEILKPLLPHAIKVLKGEVSDCKDETV
ncbi:MAG: MogA/MoaB family molybdenum cofactor biosynthesis protein [Pseudomonadota bacterium]